VILLFVCLNVSLGIYTSGSDTLLASREDVLRIPRAKNTESYKPDLRYLNERTATGLASRLAHQLDTQNVSTTAAQEERIDHTIAQRRAARVAREEAASLRSSERRDAQRTSSLREPSSERRGQFARPRQQFDGTGKLGPGQGSRGEAMRPPNPRYGGQRSRRGSLTSSDKVGVERSAGGGWPRETRDMAARSRAAWRAPVPSRIHAERADQEMSYDEETNYDEDISLEKLEEGGDEKEPAEFTDPDATFADLDDVFGRLVSRSPSIPPAQIEASVADPRWVHEISGGDYARFAPNSCRDFLVSHYKMSPIKHVQLVLSKQGDVSISARHRALSIVESSMGEARTTSVRRV
jgi:hypothetical protein